MSAATRGRVVQTPTKAQPYKVVFEHETGADTEHAVATMREGEALIKSETPYPSGIVREMNPPTPNLESDADVSNGRPRRCS